MNKQALAADMRYLRSIYSWNDDDVAEIRQAAKDDPSWWSVWRDQAASWRRAEAGLPQFDLHNEN